MPTKDLFVTISVIESIWTLPILYKSCTENCLENHSTNHVFLLKKIKHDLFPKGCIPYNGIARKKIMNDFFYSFLI